MTYEELVSLNIRIKSLLSLRYKDYKKRELRIEEENNCLFVYINGIKTYLKSVNDFYDLYYENNNITDNYFIKNISIMRKHKDILTKFYAEKHFSLNIINLIKQEELEEVKFILVSKKDIKSFYSKLVLLGYCFVPFSNNIQFCINRDKKVGLVVSENVICITDISYFSFRNLTCLKRVYLESLDYSACSTLSRFFDNCTKLESVVFKNMNVEHVNTISYMFNNCKQLNFVNFETLNLVDLRYMDYTFYDCVKLENLDLRNINTANLLSVEGFLCGCLSLSDIKGLEKFKNLVD